MNIIFEITRPNGDLSQQVWKFASIDNAVVVESYRAESRQTRRHSFKVEKAYQRLSYNHGSQPNRLTQEEVPLPDDVVEEARREFMSRVQIGFWKPSGR